MNFFDLPKNITLKLYIWYKDCGYEESLSEVLFSENLRKIIEQDGKVYFLEYPDDDCIDYGSIEEPTPKVTRRKDLDLNKDELDELTNCVDDCANGKRTQISQELAEKLIIK